jgi:hypothetical protein
VAEQLAAFECLTGRQLVELASYLTGGGDWLPMAGVAAFVAARRVTDGEVDVTTGH